jgi:hypothetical protein
VKEYMTQRIRGITDQEAVGPAKELFEASNRMLGRTANLQRILAHSPYAHDGCCRSSPPCASRTPARYPTSGCAISPC